MRTLCKYSIWMALVLMLSGCASTVFLHAASEGNTSRVVKQLSKGVDPNSKVPVLGIPAIVLASAEGHLDTVQMLVARGADVNAADATGWTALHAATRNGHKEIVRFLLEHGARIDPSTWYNPTVLAVAEKRNFPEIVDLLKAADQIRRAQFDLRVENVSSETKAVVMSPAAKD